MIIVNSKTTPSYQTLPNPRPFSTGYSSKKQYESIKQLQNEEEISIIEWIKENFFEQYSHCRKIHKIEDLFDGIALAEILSHFLPDEEQKENLFNQIELFEKLETQNNIQIASNNLNLVIEIVREMFSLILRNSESLVKKDKSLVGLVKLVQISMKLLQNFSGQSLIGNKNKMKNFMIQIIMILPEISIALKNSSLGKKQSIQKENIKPFRTESSTKNEPKNNRKASQNHHQYRSEAKFHSMGKQNNLTQQTYYNNIQQLSSIIGYSTAHNNQKMYFQNINLNPIDENYHQNRRESLNQGKNTRSSCNQNFEDKNLEQKELDTEVNEHQKKYQNKVQKLLTWIQNAYKIDISQLMEPHLLLGELVNSILAPNRLKDNEKPIKPTHYQLGSYSVYKKALDLLTEVERLNKFNLITLMKQVESGKVNQTTFWSLIQDIQSMVNNRISEPMTARRKQSRPKSVKKPTQPSQKFPTEYDQNFNYDNIKNQSVTQLLKQKENLSQKTMKLKDAPLYQEEIVRQTQLWLENEMGMSHPLNKSKPIAKTSEFENPLLNGTLFAKIIQRLRIGSAKGTVTPTDKKQLKNNIEIVKNEFLNRGYEVVRKLNIYKPSYNFYIGLISEIREIHSNKQSNTKRRILDDKQKRQIQEAQTEIPQSQRIELQKWLFEEFNESIQQVNEIKQVSLKQLKIVIEAIVNVNFLKETTEKIRLLNYIKLLQFFRSIGFSHYSTVRVQDIISENVLNDKKTQNIRWMILRDLRIIKGDKSSRT